MSGISPEERVGRRLRFRDLQVFFAVVEFGSTAKAGAKLRLTQPAVSDIVAGLEQMLGVRLFDAIRGESHRRSTVVPSSNEVGRHSRRCGRVYGTSISYPIQRRAN
jgi:hypothetical protein